MSCLRCWRSAVLFALLTLAATASAQPRGGVPRPPRIARPEIDVISVRSNAVDSSRVDVYFAVPYRILEFLFVTDKYVATYGAIVQVTDSSTDRLVLDRYESFSVVEDPSHQQERERRGIEMADVQQFTMNLKPGTYQVRLDIRDLSSHHEFDTVLMAHVRGFSGSSPMLSDPLIYRQKTAQRILPAIGGDVGTVEPGSSGVFALAYNVSDSAGWAYATVRSDKSDDPEIRRAVRTQFRSGAGQQAVFVPLDFTNLWMGSYTLDLYLLPASFDTANATPEALQRAAIATASRPLHVSVMHGIPISQADLDQAIEQLRIIATGNEWDSLTMAQTPFEKRQAIVEFWRKRDPDPYQPGNRPMEVFYERIERANAEFASGGTPGWNTDRGRMLIMLGEPDYVDKHPYEANQKPYEIWEYTSLGTRFYFVDQYLLGEYRLVGAPPPPGTFRWDQ